MKVSISFKILNSNYNKSYAQIYNNGRESENNRKYMNGIRIAVKDVISINKVIGNLDHTFELKNNETVDCTLINMSIIEMTLSNNEVIKVAVSQKIIEKYYETHRGELKYLYFCLFDSYNVIDIVPNRVFIDEIDFPKNLAEKFRE